MAAEDIATDSIIRLWEKLKKEPVEQIRPFLFSILKSRALDYLKHQKVKRNAHDQITRSLNRELEIRTNSLEASDPNDIFSSEIHDIIERTLNGLPERTRKIFIMSRFEDKSHKEISELYNITVKGVDYHIMQSVKELRLALKDYIHLLGIIVFLR
jgi:RNA polymerase sigma-70 factor (ECF subfamily)